VLAVDQQGESCRTIGPPSVARDPFGPKSALPYERAGTLIVFKVFDRVSYGLIIGARAPDAGRGSASTTLNAFLADSRRDRASLRLALSF
jgi:hypothetical protein